MEETLFQFLIGNLVNAVAIYFTVFVYLVSIPYRKPSKLMKEWEKAEEKDGFNSL